MKFLSSRFKLNFVVSLSFAMIGLAVLTLGATSIWSTQNLQQDIRATSSSTKLLNGLREIMTHSQVYIASGEGADIAPLLAAVSENKQLLQDVRGRLEVDDAQGNFSRIEKRLEELNPIFENYSMSRKELADSKQTLIRLSLALPKMIETLERSIAGEHKKLSNSLSKTEKPVINAAKFAAQVEEIYAGLISFSTGLKEWDLALLSSDKRNQVKTQLENLGKSVPSGSQEDFAKLEQKFAEFDKKITLNGDEQPKFIVERFLRTELQSMGTKLDAVAKAVLATLQTTADELAVLNKQKRQIGIGDKLLNNTKGSVREFQQAVRSFAETYDEEAMNQVARRFGAMQKRVALALKMYSKFEPLKEVANKSIAELEEMSVVLPEQLSAAIELNAKNNASLQAANANLEAVSVAILDTVAIVEARGLARGQAASVTITIVGLVALVLAVLGTFLVLTHLIRPLTSMTGVMSKLSSGDVSVQPDGIERKDELGVLARTIDVFKGNMVARDRLEAQAKETSEAQIRRQQEVERLIEDFKTNTAELMETMEDKATFMKGAAEELTSSASGASDRTSLTLQACDDAAKNVQVMADTASDLSHSINEITTKVQDTTRTVTNAAQMTSATSQKVEALSSATQEIGNVVSLISDIAEQTNLLALNATIEAARAGDAGRGFSVVASEVKNLANQTAKATEDIARQISSIQNSSHEATGAIEEIVVVMNDVNETVGQIAKAVEEQSGATEEISRNAQLAANGNQVALENVNGVTSAVQETRSISGQVSSVSNDMTSVSSQLRSEVRRFLSAVSG